MASHVLCVPLEGDVNGADNYDVVLVNVRALTSTGGASNNGDTGLEIEGTEGETPYVAKFEPADLATARASNNNPIPASAWTATLAHLLQDGPIPEAISASSQLSLAASLESARSLTIHIRQTVASSGIAQRLGELTLRADPDHEIDTLAWTATAVRRSEELARERTAAVAKATECEERVRSLVEQLAELVDVKRASEDEMLVAFADVLNAKKRKVRELQRMVDELKINASGDGGNRRVSHSQDDAGSESKEEDGAARNHGHDRSKRAPGASRKGKRKAAGGGGEADEHGSVDDEDTKMAIDSNSFDEAAGNATDDEDASDFERMPSPSGDRDVDDDEEEAAAHDASANDGEAYLPAAPPTEPAKRRMGTIGGSKSAETAKEAASDRQAASQTPPPRRELPFTRRREAVQKQQEEEADAGEETSDDEL